MVIVKLSAVVPFRGIVADPNDVVSVGGKVTLKLAEAVLPVPPLVEVTAAVVLVKSPPAVPFTFTITVQEPLTASVAPDRLTLFAPAFAVVALPVHAFETTGELASTIPAGKVSLNPTPVSASVFAAGFVSVNVKVVPPFNGILAAPNALVIEGGARTVILADAVAPVPPSTDTTALVVLVTVPVVALVMFTANVQALLSANVAPDKLTLFDPGVAIMLPAVHAPVKPFGFATVTPAGNVSVNPTPVRPTGFTAGFVTVKLRVVVPFNGIVAAPNVFARPGGITTPSEATLLPAPAAVSFAEINPVLVDCVPAARPVTFTENVQKPLPVSVAPDKLMRFVPPVAVIVPAPQVPVRPLEADITSPGGSVSLNPIPVSVSFVFGLLMVKKSWVIPLIGTVAVPNPILTLGGDVMPRLAVAVLPVPPFVDVTAPVVLVTSMGSVPLTFTLNVQEPFMAMPAPDKLTKFAPEVAVIVPPPHDPVRFAGVPTTSPEGKVSVNPTPASASRLDEGFVMVNQLVSACSIGDPV